MASARKLDRIVITGGGTGGHVFPAIRVAKAFSRVGTDILYIGSKDSMEEKLAKESSIKFKSVNTGKLRRYFSLENFVDPFKVGVGIIESIKLIKNFDPEVVFSKGGFVSVPVCIAAWRLKIPIVLHESDVTPGLANRILMKMAYKICYSFKESEKYINSEKAVLTGNPIREELYEGDIKKAKIVSGLEEDLPVIFVCGGSLGSVELNDLIKNSLKKLLPICQIVLQCGKGKQIDLGNIAHKNRLFQVEFLGMKAMANFYKFADIIISRAGAGQITELAFLAKPSILIPLGLNASRGDQIVNASILEKKSAAVVLQSDNLSEEVFVDAVKSLIKDKKLKDKLSKNIKKFFYKNAVQSIVKVIKDAVIKK